MYNTLGEGQVAMCVIVPDYRSFGGGWSWRASLEGQVGVSASEAAEEMRLGALVRLLVLLSLELLESDSINHFQFRLSILGLFW